ncbi:hypothetical protein Hanom_Chr13g01203571 [Helianthus anomalus]
MQIAGINKGATASIGRHLGLEEIKVEFGRERGDFFIEIEEKKVFFFMLVLNSKYISPLHRDSTLF